MFLNLLINFNLLCGGKVGICFCLKLSTIALAILEMPPTTATTERSFSTQGFIHLSKQNRLTTERAAKLTFVSHNLKIMNRN